MNDNIIRDLKCKDERIQANYPNKITLLFVFIGPATTEMKIINISKSFVAGNNNTFIICSKKDKL